MRREKWYRGSYWGIEGCLWNQVKVREKIDEKQKMKEKEGGKREKLYTAQK